MESFFSESCLYLICGGIVQCICAILAAPLLYLVAIQGSKTAPETLIRNYWILNVFLLLWGCLGNHVFLSRHLGKSYVSVDRMVDCYPFIPFGQWVLDQGFGGDMRGRLIGSATLWDLQVGWAMVAVPVWIAAVVCTVVTGRLVTRWSVGPAVRCKWVRS